MTTLLDLTPVLKWGAGGMEQWAVARAPVIFIDEPIRFLKLTQADPANDGDVDIAVAADLQAATLNSPIHRFGLRDGDAVALVGVKLRPVVIVSAMPGSRTRICAPIYSHKVRSAIKERDVACLKDAALFPMPAMTPVLESAGYVRLDRLVVVPESQLLPTAIELESEAAKVLEALVFAQFTGRIPSYIEELRAEFT